MTYLKRSKRPGHGKLASAIVVALLVLIFGVQYFFPSVYPTLFFPVATVFWNAESATVGFFSGAFGIIRSKYGLVKENERLAGEIAIRDRSMLMLETLRSENESLKATLGRIGKGTFVMGVVLSRPPLSPYDTIVIDIGSESGVKAGDRVYASGDILIGDIAETYGSRSKVNLYSMPGRTTSVLVGTSTVAAQATGRGGGNFVLKLPVETKIVKGATIAVPQLRSHVFGIVDSIAFDATDSLQTILFRSPVNMSQLSSVQVEISKPASK